MFCCNYFCYRIYFQFCYCYYCINVLLFYWLNIDNTFYLSNITKPNYKSNQQIQLQYTDTIFQSWCYFILPVVLLWLKRTIKGIKEKRKEGTSSQNSGRERRIFLFVLSPLFTTVDYREAGLLINSLVIPFISPYYPPCITLFILRQD